jgi:hypothetical protein
MFAVIGCLKFITNRIEKITQTCQIVTLRGSKSVHKSRFVEITGYAWRWPRLGKKENREGQVTWWRKLERKLR